MSTLQCSLKLSLQWNENLIFLPSRFHSNIHFQATSACHLILAVQNHRLLFHSQLEQCFKLTFEIARILHHDRQLEQARFFQHDFNNSFMLTMHLTKIFKSGS